MTVNNIVFIVIGYVITMLLIYAILTYFDNKHHFAKGDEGLLVLVALFWPIMAITFGIAYIFHLIDKTIRGSSSW